MGHICWVLLVIEAGEKMKKEPYFIFIILGVFLVIFSTFKEAGAMAVWTENATAKIRPNTPPKLSRKNVVLKAAKNEFEPFQLIVHADGGNLSGVDVTVSNLSDGRGNAIPSGAIMIYKEAFINITTQSTTQGATGEWPDALIPKKDEYAGEVRNAFPFSLSSGRNQPVWIEVYIPPTLPAGLYTGSATVTATGQTPIVIPIELTVWNFSLPSTSTLKSVHSTDYQYLSIGHGLGSFTDPPTPAHIRLISLYAKSNLLHRVTSDYLPAPHALGGFLSNGKINWSAFDATFGPFLDGTVQLPGEKLPGAKMTTYRMSISNHQTDVPFLQDIATHFRSKGWFDRLFEYTFDEPKEANSADWETIRSRARALHQADPELRSLVTTHFDRAKKMGISTDVDLITPNIRHMDDKPGFGSTLVGNQRSKYPAETWWYQACDSHGCGIVGGGSDDPGGYHLDWPTYMIDLPGMFSRVMEWQTFKYGLQGELYFDMVYAYRGSPWSNQHYFGGNGDGTFYYPGTPARIGGTTHIPIESIRLKLLREGMEDYEYMHLLKTYGEKAYADEQVARVVTRTYQWSKDPLVLYDAREKMALRLLVHTGTGEIPAPEPPPVPEPPAPGPPKEVLSAEITAKVSENDPWIVEFHGAVGGNAQGTVGYAWDFGDGESGSTANTDHRYSRSGSYTVVLKATDAAGREGSASRVISVTGVSGAPVAQWSMRQEESPLTYSFDASQSSGGDGTLTEYLWDFGDDTTGAGEKVEHDYKLAGIYQVKLTVTNSSQKSAAAVHSILVGGDPPPPSPGGKGGGCSIDPASDPTGHYEAIAYLLQFFAPFWGIILKKAGSLLF